MSSQPDYSFHQPAAPSSNNEGVSVLLPFSILTVAIAILMIAQTWNTFKQRSALHENEAQLADYYRSREALVKKSGDVQQQLQNLALDLLILSKTDDDAKAIINKYNIQQTGNAAGTPAAAPAAAPEPAK